MRVIVSHEAQKQYKHLPKSAQNKIARKLQALTINPYAGKKLSGELKRYWSIRVWPYRIIYEINETEKRIEVNKFAHRQRAYR